MVFAGVLAAAACNSKGSLQGTGGAGGTGGAAGAGGASCPAERPSIGAACTGSRQCDYEDMCRCGVCCYTTYRCTDGSIAYAGSTDACYNAMCDAGPPPLDGPPASGTAGAGGSGGTGGSAVCSFGADQTCNDNPILSSIRGHCTDAGVCECDGNAGTNPDSGRCL
jgi:hypothetical protein